MKRALIFAIVGFVAIPALADDTKDTPGNVPAAQPNPSAALLSRSGFSYDPANGLVYADGDFKATVWGYGERSFNTTGEDYWRRVRQGSEIDLPRFNDSLRLAAVYEIDLTDSQFGRNGVGGKNGYGRRNLENAFLALQNPDDPATFKILVGENTAILSRDDNLASGNLPTVNRSLILEEHNALGIFGPQFGIEASKQMTPGYTISLAATDGRGSFNQAFPMYSVGHSLAAKLTATPVDDASAGRRLTWGIAFDNTAGIQNQTFNLLTAIGQSSLGGLPATGNKTSGEGDLAFTFPVFRHPATLEAEGIYSHFSGSSTSVGGGYVMAQFSAFDSIRTGDLDPFLRYDLVNLCENGSSQSATQRAIRTGFNYNLPYTNKFANFHLEYAHNDIHGSEQSFGRARSSDEFSLELRFSLQKYVRH